MSNLKIYLFLQIFLSIFFFINAYTYQDVHLLISAKLNGTSPAIALKELKPDQTYLYFLFDFAYHNEHVKKSKNVAYFKITTKINIPIDEEELPKNSVAYRLSTKEWNKIKKNKIANNMMYKKVQIISKEEKNGKYNYYFKIEKKDDKKITLIIRVPTQGKREGYLDIYNILEIPSKVNLRKLANVQKGPIHKQINQNTKKNIPFTYNNKKSITKTFRRIFKTLGKVYKRSNKIMGRLKKNNFYCFSVAMLVILWLFIVILYFVQNRRKNYNQILIRNPNYIELGNINSNYQRLI